MKDIRETPDEVKDRIQAWMYLMTMRLYGFNIYNTESKLWDVFDAKTIEDVDNYFDQVLAEFKFRHKDLNRLYKALQKQEDILSR